MVAYRQSFKMGSRGLFPNQPSVRSGPDRIDVAQGCSLKQVVLLDHMLVAVFFQQSGNGGQVLFDVDFHDQLFDLRPILILDPLENIEFALLDVDLEQIDGFDLVLFDDARQCAELGLKGLRGEPFRQDGIGLLHELSHFGDAGFLLIEHESLDDLFFRLGIGVEPREQGETGEKCKSGVARFGRRARS